MSYSNGPWRMCGANDSKCICGLIWSEKDDVVVGKVVGHKDESATIGEGVVSWSDKWYANYRLLASAPELLEMLERCLELSGQDLPVEEIKALIDKAKGI